jgi:hypothetical protein
MLALRRYVSQDEGRQTMVEVYALCGELRTRVLNVPYREFVMATASYAAGTLVQDAYPMLDASDREFLMTGMTDDDWAALGDDDESTDEEGEEIPDDCGGCYEGDDEEDEDFHDPDYTAGRY